MQLDAALEILKARAETIDGLTATTDPGAPVVPPMLLIEDGELDYNVTFGRGGAVLSFTATLYVSKADSPTGLSEARSYLSGHGDYSVREALDTPSTTDDLMSKVAIDTGVRGESDNYITATFTGRAHIPGAVAT